MKKKSTYLNLNTGLGLAAVILVASIGTTLAGSILINSNTEFEFGQGIVNTTACDNTITVTPNSKLEVGEFLLDNIVISGIDEYGCAGKYLTIKVLFDNIPQIIGSSFETACKFQWQEVGWVSISGGCEVTYWDRNGENFTFTPGTEAAASLVEKITLELSST
jgi:hypothetical protein